MESPLRAQIAARVLGVALPVMGICALLLLVLNTVLQAGISRFPPISLALASAAAGYALRGMGHPLAALAAVFFGLQGAIALGMILNGGVLAPGYVATIPSAVLVAAAYGLRPLVAYVGSCFVIGGVFVAAASLGWLPEHRAFPPLIAWLFVWIFHLLAAGLVVAPIRTLEAALRRSEEQARELARAHAAERAEGQALKAVLDQSFQLMGLLAPDGLLLKANAASLKMIGAKAEDVLGRPFPDTPWWDAAQRPAVIDAIRRAAAGERVRMRSTHVDVQGRTRLIDFSLSPYRDAEGRVVYLIPEGRDITEPLEADERLHQARKMESLGRLAGGVAHDFNNMLTGILGSADLLKRTWSGTEAGRSHLDVIEEAARRAAELTKSLLVYARKAPMDLRPVDLNDVLQASAKLLERSLRAGIELTLKRSAEAAVVQASAGHLENAVINLGLNARDAMPEGGRLGLTVLRIRLRADEGALRPAPLPAGDYAALEVRDTGTGMDEATLARLFEPFFSSKGPGEGTGLGLCSVLGTAVEHRGALRVESAPGRGTVVTLYLPLCGDARPAAAAPAAALPPRPARILVVDDEPTLRSLAAQILRSLGHAVETAADGREALACLQSSPGAFQLLVVDMSMPGMDGKQLCRGVRAVDRSVRIIVATGYCEAEDREELKALGVSLVLDKPYSVGTLSSAAAEALRA